LSPLGGFQIKLRFADEPEPERFAIPYGMSGCVLHYAVAPAPLTSYDDLKDDVLMTPGAIAPI
jgi:hypothetical protein